MRGHAPRSEGSKVAVISLHNGIPFQILDPPLERGGGSDVEHYPSSGRQTTAHGHDPEWYTSGHGTGHRGGCIGHLGSHVQPWILYTHMDRKQPMGLMFPSALRITD